MGNPFTAVECSIRYDNARVLTWSLDPKINYPNDFILQVENAREGGDWTILQTGITNACTFIDSRQRNYNKKMNECYRIRLIIESTEEEWVSPVVHADSYKAYPFSAEAENVIKQIENNIRLAGCSGVLLKKKHWGTRCPDCTDFDGQQTVNEHCTRCLGTGFDGGYYNGISMDIIKDAVETVEDQGDDCVEARETIKARCIAYPWVRYGDVWCEDNTNRRYVIHQVVPTSIYKQTVLVYTITMHRVEYNDVLHTSVADTKVHVKDIFETAAVTVTPSTANAWDSTLGEL